MDPILVDLLEPAVVFATLLGTAFGVKLLIWGKGPIKKVRQPEVTAELSDRVSELEERLEQSNDVIAHQAELLDEVIERVDFSERLLARYKDEPPKGLAGSDS